MDREIKYLRKVYQTWLDFGEELATSTTEINPYNIVSIQQEPGPGSMITLHFLYYDEIKDEDEPASTGALVKPLVPWQELPTHRELVRLLNGPR